MMNIVVKSFSNIELDGVSAGDALSVYSNYPHLALPLKQALEAYDEGRQSFRPNVDLTSLSEALIAGSFDEWLTATWGISATALRASMALITALENGDIEGVRSNFHKIAAVSPPSLDQLEEWQGVLDTLEIPKDVLAFIP